MMNPSMARPCLSSRHTQLWGQHRLPSLQIMSRANIGYRGLRIGIGAVYFITCYILYFSTFYYIVSYFFLFPNSCFSFRVLVVVKGFGALG